MFFSTIHIGLLPPQFYLPTFYFLFRKHLYWVFLLYIYFALNFSDFVVISTMVVKAELWLSSNYLRMCVYVCVCDGEGKVAKWKADVLSKLSSENFALKFCRFGYQGRKLVEKINWTRIGGVNRTWTNKVYKNGLKKNYIPLNYLYI